MESPKNLPHKPIVSVKDYNEVDGPCKGPNTDAKALSIGWALYDEDDIAMKVWRHTGTKWSRQSEELPIHRNLDLTILLLHVLFDKGPNPDSFLVSPKSMVTEDEPNGIQTIRQYYEDNKQYLEPRLMEIKRLLEEGL